MSDNGAKYMGAMTGLMLRAKIVDQAQKWNDGAAEFLAGHDRVSIAEIHRRVGQPSPYIVYRFTLPTGDDIEWDPDDGWDGPSNAMDCMAKWVAALENNEELL